MGCGASNAADENAQVTETAKVEVKPEGDATSSPAEVENKKTEKPPTIAPKLNKAQELRLAKIKEEKAEEEKKKGTTRPLGTIAKMAQSTVRLTKAQQKQQEEKEALQKKLDEKRSSTGTGGSTLKTKSNSNLNSATSSPRAKSPAPTAKRSDSKASNDGFTSVTPGLSSSGNTNGSSDSFTNPLSAAASSSLFAASGSGFAPPPVSYQDKDFEGFQNGKLLGKGAYGSTYECALASCRIVCVKVIEFGDLADGSTEMENLRNEIAIMKRFRHPNIVQYYGCTEDKKARVINIFMELVTGGTLNHYMKKFEKVPIETARNWARQMCEGVKYLHDQGIVHRDIKGANILMTNDGVVKLADFGCSKSIDDACSKTKGCQTMVGTPYFMAPEVLKCESYGTKSDVWSIGCTIVEMITGQPPWPQNDNMWGMIYKIANSKGLPPLVPKDIPKKMMEFLEKCFQRDPKKRASCDELLKSPWLQE